MNKNSAVDSSVVEVVSGNIRAAISHQQKAAPHMSAFAIAAYRQAGFVVTGVPE